MGFTTEYSHYLTPFLFKNTHYSYTQIIFCYPQSILTKKKRVGKTSFSFPTRCVKLLLILFSYPHVYN